MKDTNELKLKVKLNESEKDIEECMKQLSLKRRELVDIETKMVYAREQRDKAAESLREYRMIHVGETSVLDHRDQQIAEYKERMPELMKRIENEAPMPYAHICDLGTTSAPGFKKVK